MRADLTLALIALLWGSTFVLVKRALDDVSPLLFLVLRFGLATLVLGWYFRKRIAQGFRRKEVFIGIGVGAMLMLGYVLQTIGLKTTSPSKSAFLTGLYIVLVPFANSLVYRIAPRFAELIGVLLAGMGMALLSMQGESLTMTPGDLLTVGCAVAFALHIVMLSHFAPILGFESLSVLQIGGAALVALVSMPLVEQPVLRWSPSVIAAILVGGLLATALAFVLMTWAQQRTTPTRAAVIYSLEPVFAWIVSWLWEGEILGQRAAFGAILILAGILVVELKPAGSGKHPSQ